MKYGKSAMSRTAKPHSFVMSLESKRLMVEPEVQLEVSPIDWNALDMRIMLPFGYT
jgi:hypothetical protein